MLRTIPLRTSCSSSITPIGPPSRGMPSRSRHGKKHPSSLPWWHRSTTVWQKASTRWRKETGMPSGPDSSRARSTRSRSRSTRLCSRRSSATERIVSSLLSPSHHGETAPHAQRLAGDEGRLVGGEEHDGRRHLLRRGQAAERRRPHDGLDQLLVPLGREPAEQRGVGEARGHHVDADPGGRHLAGQGLAEGDDRPLRPRVHRLARRARPARLRAHVDDHAALPRDHLGEDRVAGGEDAAVVDGDHRVPELLGRVHEPGDPVPAGDVREDVDSPPRPGHLVDPGHHARAPGHIHDHRHRLAARSRDLGRDGLGTRSVDVRHGHAGSLGGRPEAHRPADPAGAARDQCHPALEDHQHSLLRSREEGVLVILEGRVALVTGGASGIGRAVCLRAAAEGARVAVADVNGAGAEAVAAEITAAGGQAMPVVMDVTRRASVVAGVDEVTRAWGGIDILANVAGWDRITRFVDTTEEFWDTVIAINYRGVLATCHAVLPQMIARQRGVIVNVSSEAGRAGSSGEAVYSGAKGAVIAFSKALAREVAPSGIRVNVVAPGLTDTPLLRRLAAEGNEKLIQAIVRATPLGRLATPEEVAAAVVFLASDEASFITGQTLSVGGGLTMV